jgi:hypothetical protein
VSKAIARSPSFHRRSVTDDEKACEQSNDAIGMKRMKEGFARTSSNVNREEQTRDTEICNEEWERM